MRRLAPLALLLLAAAPARAVEVRVSEAPRVTFSDRAVQVEVELVDLDEDVRSVTLAADPALQVRGPISRGQTVRVVNGERAVSYGIVWEVTPPDQPGDYSLGPVTVVTASGEEVRQPLGGTLSVVQRAPPGSAKLLVDSVAGGPVGHPFRVEYQLLTAEAPYEAAGVFGAARYPFGLERLALKVLEADLPWEPARFDPDQEATGLRVGEQQTLLVQAGIVEHEGLGYHGTRFALQVTPREAGPLDLSASARLQVVAGSRRVRDLFGGVQEVARSEAREVASGPATYLVAELPPGAPAGFTGAVGRYAIEVTCAQREANAFDPIEVTVRVSGEGLLEDVVLPNWGAIPAIREQFQVATDVDPGRLEGGAKVFTKTFRARSAAVTALPALPFPYFDPATGQYAIARSAPIPLVIREVDTVTAEDAIGGGGPGDLAAPGPGAAAGSGAALEAIAPRGGIGANYLELGDERATFRSPARWDALLLAAVLAPPLLLLASLLLPRLRRRLAGGPTPLTEALTAIEGGDLEAVRAGLHAYAGRRLGLGGEVTAGELEQALRARVVTPAVVEQAVQLWRDLEVARFSGGGTPPSDAADVLREVDRCL